MKREHRGRGRSGGRTGFAPISRSYPRCTSLRCSPDGLTVPDHARPDGLQSSWARELATAGLRACGPRVEDFDRFSFAPDGAVAFRDLGRGRNHRVERRLECGTLAARADRFAKADGCCLQAARAAAEQHRRLARVRRLGRWKSREASGGGSSSSRGGGGTFGEVPLAADAIGAEGRGPCCTSAGTRRPTRLAAPRSARHRERRTWSVRSTGRH